MITKLEEEKYLKSDMLPLSEVALIISGVSFPKNAKKSINDKGVVACLRTANIQYRIDWSDLWFVDRSKINSKKINLLKVGDILVSMSNSLKLVGKSAFASQIPQEVTFGAFLCAVRPKDGVNGEYVHFMMNAPQFRKYLRSIASTTTNISNINVTKLSTSHIPVPDKKIQDGVAEECRRLFSKIDVGEESLKRVQALVKQYRQSVLKAAVTGELTKEWREKNKGQHETGEDLLKRILKARREAWEEAELEKFRAKGKEPKNDKWKEKYVEPAAPDTTDLPDLPKGWVWGSLAQLTLSSQNGLSKRRGDEGSPVTVLRLADVIDREIADTDLREIVLTAKEQEKYSLRPTDILCVRVNGSRNLVGRLIECQQAEGWAYCDHFIRYRFCPTMLPSFMVAAFDANPIRQWVLDGSVSSAGQNTVNQSSLGLLPIPIPPEDEQKEICTQLELENLRIGRLVADIAEQTVRTNAMRQTVLKAAFSGELVKYVEGETS